MTTQTQAQRSADAFIQGWIDQATYERIACKTPRQVQRAYSYKGDEVDAYLNGVEDCKRGDDFRMRRALNISQTGSPE